MTCLAREVCLYIIRHSPRDGLCSEDGWLSTINQVVCLYFCFCVSPYFYLCHLTDCLTLQVGIYLLEAGISKPEFLGEGNSRLKKANQLMQKLMEYFYDFIIPGKKLQIPDKCSLQPHFHHSCIIAILSLLISICVWLTLKGM